MFVTMSLRWRLRSTMIAMLLLGVLLGWGSGLAVGEVGLFSGFLALLLVLANLWLEAQIVRPVERLREQALKVASGKIQQVDLMNRGMKSARSCAPLTSSG